MKIKTKELSIEEVEKLPEEKYIKPKKPNIIFKTLLKILSNGDLKATNFTYNKINMDKLGKKEPCLILMNHSSFIDLKIISKVFYPRSINIICTSDGFIGKKWLMRNLGCVPTNKFVSDAKLVKDMVYCVNTLKDSILMYPEASYSFDGTATPLPQTLGKLLKLLKVPVIMVKTYGAFSRDPLYNNLQLRNVKVSADIEYLLSPQEIQQKTVEELNNILKDKFTFDSFKWQQENDITIDESFRADCLNRVLYKCPHCKNEGNLIGKGITIKCNSCNTEYELTTKGYLNCLNNEGKFNHIPDWYRWEREEVKQEIDSGNYQLNTEVDIYVMKGTKYIYKVGQGILTHNNNGFKLVGCDNKLNYTQSVTSSYSLYADYYWYEIGDVVCIGTNKILYYCFPKNKDVVAKTRMATEELFKKYSVK